MSTTPGQPNNINGLQGNAYSLAFATLPNVQYFCRSANLPGVSLPEIVQSTPLSAIYHPGDVPEYETLNIDFLVDEDMYNWLEMYSWITNLGFDKDLVQFNDATRDHGDGGLSSATLLIETNKRNPNLSVQFDCLFPINLSEITFTVEEPEQRYASASFRFTTYTVARLND